MMLDNNSEDSYGRLRQRRDNYYRNGIVYPTSAITTTTTTHQQHQHSDTSNGSATSASASASAKRFQRSVTLTTTAANNHSHSSNTSSHNNSHRYYRVQHSHPSLNATTILLMMFVTVAAIIAVMEWTLIYKLEKDIQHVHQLLPLNALEEDEASSLSLSSSSWDNDNNKEGPVIKKPRHHHHHLPHDGKAKAAAKHAAVIPDGDQEDAEEEQEQEDGQPVGGEFRNEEEFVEDEEEEDNNNNNQNRRPLNFNYVQDDPDKEPILKILRQAGMDTDTELDFDTYQQLPPWSQIQRLFGTEPRIFGLGQDEEKNCAAFRNSTDPTIRFFGIAGAFNSGTNLLASLMTQNCQITERMLVYGEKSKGVRWQVPWGKHTLARYRLTHFTSYDKDVPPFNSLPLVTIRDPYQWMQSMCRHPYTLRGMFSEETCPHLVQIPEVHRPWNPRLIPPPYSLPQDSKYVNVRVRYSKTIPYSEHESLAHFWNDWYQDYIQADFPRIVVRFEDLLFYAEPVIRQLCQCGGGVPRREEFMHIQDSAKLGTMAHGHDKTSLLKAILLYGNDLHRYDTLTAEDLQAAKELFDPFLMKVFNYQHPQ